MGMSPSCGGGPEYATLNNHLSLLIANDLMDSDNLSLNRNYSVAGILISADEIAQLQVVVCYELFQTFQNFFINLLRDFICATDHLRHLVFCKFAFNRIYGYRYGT